MSFIQICQKCHLRNTLFKCHFYNIGFRYLSIIRRLIRDPGCRHYCELPWWLYTRPFLLFLIGVIARFAAMLPFWIMKFNGSCRSQEFKITKSRFLWRFRLFYHFFLSWFFFCLFFFLVMAVCLIWWLVIATSVPHESADSAISCCKVGGVVRAWPKKFWREVM